jgi:23S rRNA (guanosine2251-2'-O)-methyltransferase
MNKKLFGRELGRKSEEEFRQADKIPVTVVLDNVRSGLNVGSVLRTADAFRFEQVFMCGITASPPQKDILKSSLGAERTVSHRHFADTLEAIELLKSEGYTILAVEQCADSNSLLDFAPASDGKFALVMGNEVRGVEEAVLTECDQCLEIPMQGTKHSLNVSVCAGIVMWHFFSKMSGLSR